MLAAPLVAAGNVRVHLAVDGVVDDSIGLLRNTSVTGHLVNLCWLELKLAKDRYSADRSGSGGIRTLVDRGVGGLLNAVAGLGVLVQLLVDGVLDEIHDDFAGVVYELLVVKW